MDIAGLIERLEKADGPDRELDARIAVALGDIIMRGSDQGGWAFWEAPMKKGDWAFLSNCRHGADKAYRDLGQCLNVKKYTASVYRALNAPWRRVEGFHFTRLPTPPAPVAEAVEVLEEPVAYRVHDFHIVRQPVKARGKFPEPTEYLYPASRAEDAKGMAKIVNGTCSPLYQRKDEQ